MTNFFEFTKKVTDYMARVAGVERGGVEFDFLSDCFDKGMDPIETAKQALLKDGFPESELQ
jgi:hypothetical protein